MPRRGIVGIDGGNPLQLHRGLVELHLPLTHGLIDIHHRALHQGGMQGEQIIRRELAAFLDDLRHLPQSGGMTAHLGQFLAALAGNLGLRVGQHLSHLVQGQSVSFQGVGIEGLTRRVLRQGKLQPHFLERGLGLGKIRTPRKCPKDLDCLLRVGQSLLGTRLAQQRDSEEMMMATN